MSFTKTQTPAYRRQNPNKPSVTTQWLPDWIVCLLETPTPNYRTAPAPARTRNEP